MRKVLLLLFVVAVQQVAAQTELDDHYKAKTANAVEYKKLLGKNSGLLDNYNVTYHKLDLELNPNLVVPTIKGSVTTYFEALVNNFQQFAFSLRCDMLVDSVIYHGDKLAASCVNDLFTISLSSPLAKGSFDSLEIFYHGTPISRPGFTRSVHASAPIIWTFSEPYWAADWWPCKQTLTDKIDSIDIIVRTPPAYRVASNGILAAEYNDGSDKVFHWKHRYPVATYLVAIAVSNYQVFSEYAPLIAGDSVEILNYVYPISLPVAKAEVPKLKPVMRLYDSLFVGYPFKKEKYGHAQFGLGGGMEHQTMSFMTSYNFDLMAHELAHQWFGDKVTCGTWADLWLNEGFATYLTGLTYNYLSPKPLWIKQLNTWIDNITAKDDGSVFVPDTINMNRLFDQRLTYQKGAMMLHMLRWKMGDSAFYSAIRNYLTDPFIEYSFAKTADLKKKFEEAYGANLDEFFADWYYGQGYPKYNISWKQSGAKITVQLQQVPSHSSVSFFEIAVPLLFKNGQKDSIVVIDPQENKTEYVFFLPFTADSLLFDPDRWLLAKASVLKEGNINNPKKLILWPNPTGHAYQETITVSANDILLDRFDVFDDKGRRIYSYEPEAPFSEYKLHVEDWPIGVYYLSAQSGDLRLTEIFVRF